MRDDTTKRAMRFERNRERISVMGVCERNIKAKDQGKLNRWKDRRKKCYKRAKMSLIEARGERNKE